jgi:hypothetical protein
MENAAVALLLKGLLEDDVIADAQVLDPWHLRGRGIGSGVRGGSQVRKRQTGVGFMIEQRPA